MRLCFGIFLLGVLMSQETMGQSGFAAAETSQRTVWCGTGGTALYRATFDERTGELSEPEVAAKIKSPGFVCANQAGTLLYSLGTPEGAEGNVAVYSVSADKNLQLLGTADTGCGKGTHLSLSADERTLLVAHYGGGKVASLRLDPSGKILSPVSVIAHEGSSVNQARQSEAHPHWIGVSPDGRFAMVPDLGMDEVLIYRLDSNDSTLTYVSSGKVPAGQGPRHLKFHPNGKWAYVINELGLTVTGFAYDSESGALEPFQTEPALAESQVKDILTSGSEIRIHPNGKFLYAGIRGHDVVAVFALGATGRMELVELEPVRGSWPRNFGLTPSGNWLLAAGAESNTLAVFQVDPEVGRLTFTRKIVNVPGCICVAFQ